MDTYAIYFWPKGTLASMPGSDTIFGAVCWGIQLLRLADVGRMLTNFDPPKFAFSSPCPVYRHGDLQLRFYPRPAWFRLVPDDIDQLAQQETRKDRLLNRKMALVQATQKAKQFKKLTHFSESIFREVIEGKLKALDFCERLLKPGRAGNRDDQIEQIGLTAMSYAERAVVHPHGAINQPFLQPQAVQHNHIDRLAGATVEGLLFYDNEIFFAPNSGLWSLLRAEKTTLDQLIRPALRYLADTGLGANRTAGRGQFTIEVADAPPLPDAGASANGLVMLSRYIPKSGEWSATGQPLAYNLITLTAKREKKFVRSVHGQTTPPIYKRRLRILEAGCVVPYQTQTDIYGRLVEVVPDEGDGHRTWQSGLAIGIRAKVEVQHG